MILLQNPNIPTSVNPVEIDSAILDIKSELESGLTWLTNGYGRAFKNLDITNGERVYFPEIYLGKQNGSYRYTNISPDNDKQGQCFFYVRRETISEYQTGMYSFLNYDVALIFSVNMELINSTLTETEVFQQILIAQVRDVLTRQILGKSYVLKVNTVEFVFEDVFREFNLSEQSTMEKSPLSHFRFNLSLKMPETCPTPSIIPPVVPCVVGSTFSTPLDGVNSYIVTKVPLSDYDLEGTDTFTFSFYIKPSVLQEGDIINKFSATSPTIAKGYFVRLSATGEIRFGLSNNSNRIDVKSPSLIVVNVWQHVLITYDGSELSSGVKIYIDGIIQANTVIQDNLTGSINNPAQILKLGANIVSSRYYAGLIDDVKMWNIVLTPTEAKCPTDLYSANLFFYNKMGELSLFGFTNRHYPDETGLTFGYSSQNMGIGDISTDTIS